MNCLKHLETLKIIENCINCGNYYYFNGIYQSIREIGNHLVELEKEQEKRDIIHKLSNKLIKVDFEINGHALCEVCKTKKSISKLFNLLDQLINRSNLTVRITSLSSELLETLKI